jgi:hypothetical protein
VGRWAAALVIAVFLVGASAADAAAPALQKLVLSPKQIGSGYRMQTIPQGNVVRGQVTLDLCGFQYLSERLRLARLQNAYLHAGGVDVSNEVVRYKPGGARQALAEIQYAAAHCPRGPVSGPVRGVGPTTYRLTRVTDPRLLPGHVALIAHMTGTAGKRHFDVRALAVYQVRGDFFSGVYTDGTSSVTAQRRVGLHAAEESAKNLKQLVQ